uniref:Cytochrome c domain-containing protein n=1 Tax=Parascaris univalens TaxID=6257 RepID=A0A915AFH8_PARUN
MYACARDYNWWRIKIKCTSKHPFDTFEEREVLSRFEGGGSLIRKNDLGCFSCHFLHGVGTASLGPSYLSIYKIVMQAKDLLCVMSMW